MNAQPGKLEHRSPLTHDAWRWLLLYFLLAAFDVAAVTISLSLNHRITQNFERSVVVNRIWAERQGIYADLGLIASEVNAPGNNVFASLDPDTEEARLRSRADVFRINAHEARRDLRAELEPDDAAPMIALLDYAVAAMERQIAAATGIFGSLRAGDAPTAGRRMAEMDQEYNVARAYLSELDGRVRVIQRRNLDAQAEAAASLRRFEMLIAGLIVLMVTSVALYGRALIRGAQRLMRERDRHVAVIAENEAKLGVIVRTASEGILTVDQAGRIESANPAAGAIFACSPASLVGRSAKALFAPESAPVTTPCAGREVAARRDTGAMFPLELAISEAVPVSGGAISTWIVRDISDRKQIETELSRYREHLEDLVEERTAELEASNEQLRTAERFASIGTLAAGLGHDMKNLLFPMRCRLDLLESLRLSDGAAHELKEIRSSLNYLQRLSNGLRLLSINPDDCGASSATTDLREWWSEVGGLLTKPVPPRLTLRVDLPEATPRVAIAAHQLTQAILNLIVNAAEAIEGEGSIRLWAEPVQDGAWVQLAVEDDGAGMTPDVRRHAMDPFFTTKKRELSTGLGLSLVHAAVRSVGGGVHIDSRPGAGTSIVLTLPTERAGAPSEREVVAADGGETEATRPIHAVVSLGDARLASLAHTILTAAGASVTRSPDTNGARGPSLWVTEDAVGRRKQIASFICAHPANQVLVIGRSQGKEPSPPQVRSLESGSGAELRRVILESLEDIQEASS